jgi:hypothetical protein
MAVASVSLRSVQGCSKTAPCLCRIGSAACALGGEGGIICWCGADDVGSRSRSYTVQGIAGLRKGGRKGVERGSKGGRKGVEKGSKGGSKGLL